MSITRLDPNKIVLGGDWTEVGDIAASEAITPGHLIERFNSGGVIRWRKATADLNGPCSVALDQAMVNKGVDDAYALADLVQAGIPHSGGTFWGLIASGQNITAGTLMGSAGGGTFKSGATVALATALENKPTVLVATRIRLEAL